MKFRLCALIPVAFLCGCAIGPEYERPEIVTPTEWRVPVEKPEELANVRWWEAFEDPALTKLIETALTQNKDLKIATARVEEFYSRYGVSRSELFPQIEASGGYSRRRSSESLGIPNLGGALRNTNTVSLDLGWEIDLWGKIRRSNESTLAALLSEEASRRGVILSLVSTVATSYIELRSLDRQLEIALETLKSRQEAFKLAQRRFEVGATSELDLKQAESELLTAEVAIPIYEAQIARQENALSSLLGQNPGAIVRGKSIEALRLKGGIPVGIPSDILMQRPDIIQAEQNLVAANADVGVAYGEFFPSISLTGSYGRQSADFSDLFHGPSKTWGYGPSINLPIFTAGKILNSVEAAQARKTQALVGYQKAIQEAFREVDDALIGYKKSHEERDVRARQVDAFKRYLELANVNYDAGQVGYLEVLDAERRLFTSQLEFAQSEGQYVSSMVTLYRALGGGWLEEASKSAEVKEISSEGAPIPAP